MLKVISAIFRGRFFNFPSNLFKKVRIYSNFSVRGHKKKLIFESNIRIYDNVTIVINSQNAQEHIYIGENSIIETGCYLNAHGGYIQIQKNVHIGVHNIIQGKYGVTIGSESMLGPFVQIYSSNHKFNAGSKPRRLFKETGNKIVIGENNWICANSIILSGTSTSQNLVILPAQVVKNK